MIEVRRLAAQGDIPTGAASSASDCLRRQKHRQRGPSETGLNPRDTTSAHRVRAGPRDAALKNITCIAKCAPLPCSCRVTRLLTRAAAAFATPVAVRMAGTAAVDQASKAGLG